MINELFRRVWYLMNRRRLDDEMAGDMEFHREMAARVDGRPLGNELLLREQSRDAWGWAWIDRLSQDLRYAVRMLRKSPGFTLAAVLMLGLGIGVNVAAFGFFDLMFLRPLPVRDPATLLQFDRSAPEGFADNFVYPEVAFYGAHSKTLSAVMAVNFGKLTMDGGERQLNTQFVTANFFSELGARARLGRMLDATRDAAPGAEPVVVLGQEFWRRHFGSDPNVAGKTIRLNGQSATVVGVASAQFSGLGSGAPDLWAPIDQQPYFARGGRLTDFSDGGVSVLMWGRLQGGATPAAAEEELKSLAAELHRQHPKDVWDKESLPSRPGGYANSVRHEMVPILALVGALGLLILAAACGNLGSLLLARGVAREREMAIRVAVGAGRGRLMRQLFTESLVLAMLGSMAGFVLGYVVERVLMVWAGVPAWMNATPDGRVMAFAAGMGLAAAILFGLAPAWQSARQRHRGTATRQFLIGAQVAASCVLLIVAGLLVRALHRAMFAPPGFDYQHVISIDPHFHGESPEEARVYLEGVETRLRDLPGVVAVSMVSNPPLGNRWTVDKSEAGGRPVNLHYNHVDPPFFRTMQIPLLRGRNLERGDTRGIIVSESLARLQWPGGDPVGKAFRAGEERFTVVGVAGSARLVSPEDSDAVEIYQLPNAAMLSSMVVLVRTAGPSEGLVSLVGSTVKRIAPKLFPEVQLMKSAYREKLQTAQYSAAAVGVLGVVALLLACAGIVGMVGYGVSQRTKEIGIRMALGARPASVLAVVLRRFFFPAAVGLLVGMGGAAALSKFLRGLLYGVNNLDPAAYLAGAGFFALIAGMAAVLPARSALRVDPLRALRYE
jgi:predicted permease